MHGNKMIKCFTESILFWKERVMKISCAAAYHSN
jgi:hypothetical protein